MYPFLQMQLYEPFVLVQLTLASQTWLLSLHSSISVNIVDLQRVTEYRKKILASLSDNKAIISDERLFYFFLSIV